MSKFLNISTDNTLGGSSASDDTVASQKAVKDYIDAHSGGANQDLSNLTSTGQNIANWSSNVTNCITEIPQDIKLELNNGTLTLKAGSKVYAPNGFELDGVTPKFDVLDITTDVTISVTFSANVVIDVVFDRTTLSVTRLGGTSRNNNTSGTTPPTTGLFYNTSTNKIDYYSSGTISRTGSFPICIFTDSTSFEVFNGFGYIGSTIFALPGVKGLIPNGRNADGTLKNKIKTVENVIIRTKQSGANKNLVDVILCDNYNEYNNFLDVELSTFVNENNYLQTDIGEILDGFTCLCMMQDSNYKITSLTPKTAFHALDYNDSSTISSWSMPSGRYITLTAGAHGSGYIAPANGYFCVKGYHVGGGVQNVFSIVNATTEIGSSTIPPTVDASVASLSIEARKGDTVYIYNYGGTFSSLIFVYAEGEA